MTGLISVPGFVRGSYLRVLFYVTKPQDDPAALKQQHKATKVISAETGKLTYDYTKNDYRTIQSDSARCVVCHGSMLEKDKKGNPVNYIHSKMLQASMLNFYCTDCHKTIDIRKRSPGHVTRRVDRLVCPVCHDPSSTGKTAEESGGSSFASINAPGMPEVMSLHGNTEKQSKKWISEHSKVAMTTGISNCRKCHIKDSELDFCSDCHLRGGFMPESHQVTYELPINKIYPESSKTDVVSTTWKGYHFVFVREALEKLGAKVESAQQLPMDKIEKLPCGACHILEDWCTKCHIKHDPNWLNPNDGHPAYVDKYGTKYCFRCHDSLGSKCLSCHTYVGQLTSAKIE